MARLVAAPPQNGRAAGWEREIRGRWLMSWSLAGGDGKGGKEGGRRGVTCEGEKGSCTGSMDR